MDAVHVRSRQVGWAIHDLVSCGVPMDMGSSSGVPMDMGSSCDMFAPSLWFSCVLVQPRTIFKSRLLPKAALALAQAGQPRQVDTGHVVRLDEHHEDAVAGPAADHGAGARR